MSGPRIVTSETKAEMKKILDDIQSGRFVRDWMNENAAGQASFKATRRRGSEHPIEEVGARLRGMMPWITKTKLVDTARNGARRDSSPCWRDPGARAETRAPLIQSTTVCRRLRSAAPTPPRPRIISAQLPGSGAAASAISKVRLSMALLEANVVMQ